MSLPFSYFNITEGGDNIIKDATKEPIVYYDEGKCGFINTFMIELDDGEYVFIQDTPVLTSDGRLYHRNRVCTETHYGAMGIIVVKDEGISTWDGCADDRTVTYFDA